MFTPFVSNEHWANLRGHMAGPIKAAYLKLRLSEAELRSKSSELNWVELAYRGWGKRPPLLWKFGSNSISSESKLGFSKILTLLLESPYSQSPTAVTFFYFLIELFIYLLTWFAKITVNKTFYRGRNKTECFLCIAVINSGIYSIGK